MIYQTIHQPVLVNDIIGQFRPTASDILLDTTLGTGGHAAAYLEASAPDGRVVGLDADPEAIATARQRLQLYGDRVTYLKANFANLKNSLLGGGIVEQDNSFEFSHILFDLGIGSHQIANSQAGFSWHSLGPLTMRYGTGETLPDSSFPSINYLTQQLGHYPDVLDIITRLKKDELSDIIHGFGEERYAKRIAQAIKDNSPATTQQLANVITKAVPSSYQRGRLHPATRTFQALRLAVNRELEALSQALPQAVDLLRPNGQIAVISFHSLEDRLVKNFFRQSELKVITKKPITADLLEVRQNPKSKSAKLRIAVKPIASSSNQSLKTSKQTHDTKHFSKRNSP